MDKHIHIGFFLLPGKFDIFLRFEASCSWNCRHQHFLQQRCKINFNHHIKSRFGEFLKRKRGSVNMLSGSQWISTLQLKSKKTFKFLSVIFHIRMKLFNFCLEIGYHNCFGLLMPHFRVIRFPNTLWTLYNGSDDDVWR